VMSVADEVPTPEMRAFTTAVSRVAGDRR